MKSVRATRNHSFGHRRRTVGEIYQVPDKYTRVLELLGVAVEILPPVVKKSIDPSVPFPPPRLNAAKAAESEPRRQYKRRDMKAEE